jgi:hypothetical protein
MADSLAPKKPAVQIFLLPRFFGDQQLGGDSMAGMIAENPIREYNRHKSGPGPVVCL